VPAEGGFDPIRILAALHEAGVQFVLIGGMAAVLYGDVGVTVDLDVVPARTPDNLDRLAAALRTLDARVRVADVPAGLAADGVTILVASLADVIRSKEAANREKDRAALPRLRRLRDRMQRENRRHTGTSWI
jgi:hypothetical protein